MSPDWPASSPISTEATDSVTLRGYAWRPTAPTHRPVLLLHGLASNARLWDGVGPRLAALGHHAVALDLRGHGQSDKPDSGYDVATVADDVAAALNSLGWEDVTVVGQSWGGNVVVEFAHRHPDLVHSIVAVDGGFIELANQFESWEQCATVLAPPQLAGIAFADLEERLNAAHADWPASGRNGALACFQRFPDGTAAPWLTFAHHMEVLHGLYEHQPSTRFSEIATPVAFIVAQDEAPTPWAGAKNEAVISALGMLQHGRAIAFSPAHHDIHAQYPKITAEIIHEAAAQPKFFATTPAYEQRTPT